MSWALDIPQNYGYVLVIAASTSFINFYHFFLTGYYRKTSGIQYPAPYASNEQAEKDPNAFAFNCGALLLSGYQYPVASAAFGAGWVISRIVYAHGYSHAGPPGRLPGARGAFVFDSLLKFMSLYSAVRIATSN